MEAHGAWQSEVWTQASSELQLCKTRLWGNGYDFPRVFNSLFASIKVGSILECPLSLPPGAWLTHCLTCSRGGGWGLTEGAAGLPCYDRGWFCLEARVWKKLIKI